MPKSDPIVHSIKTLMYCGMLLYHSIKWKNINKNNNMQLLGMTIA